MLMATNQADEKDLGQFQPISEESSSQAHREELVMMGPEHACIIKLKRPRDSDSEEPISTSRSYTDHDATDSCPPAMQNTLRSFPSDSGSGSYTAVKESYSNRIEIIGETGRTGVKRPRIQHDGYGDGSLIQYASSGYYLWLNDCGTYDLEMTKYLPIQTNPLREKYLFWWMPRADRAGLLTVLSKNYYVALDTSTKKLKIVRNSSPQFTDNELVHRRQEESPGFCMLFFNCNDKYYQIKVDENGAPTVEELNSQDDLKKEYMWKATL